MDAYNPELEKGLVAARETMPRIWWALYCGCLQVGFSDSQSLSLVHTYLLSQNPYGIRPDSGFRQLPSEPD